MILCCVVCSVSLPAAGLSLQNISYSPGNTGGLVIPSLTSPASTGQISQSEKLFSDQVTEENSV